jgi:hypothetical protein
VGCNTSTNACNPAMVCTPLAYQCTGSGSLSLQQCNAGGTAWTSVKTCSTICDAAHGECDECKAPAYNCAANALQECSSSGHWQTLKDCMMATCNPAGTCDPTGGAGAGGGGAAGAPGGGSGNAGAPSGGSGNAGAPSGGDGSGGAPGGGGSNAGAPSGGESSAAGSLPGP